MTTISTCSPTALSSVIVKTNAVPVGVSWMWTLTFGYHQDRTLTHGYAETHEAAMAAFAKSLRRE
jgi:hypothetical protein